MTKEESILAEAQRIAKSAKNYVELSNALFDPEGGLLARAYPNREEREEFVKTKEYAVIRQLLNHLDGGQS